TEIHDDIEAKTLVAGYRGQQGDSLQSLTLGYGGFVFPFYPGISPDNGESSIPAIMVHVKTDNWENHSRLSWHEGEWKEQYYSMEGEIFPETFPLSSIAEPVEFILPDANLSNNNLEIWIEDNRGGIFVRPANDTTAAPRKFKLAESGLDYRIDLDTGRLELLKQKAFAIRYSIAGNNIGSSVIGENEIFDIFEDGWPNIDYTASPPSIPFSWGGASWLAYLTRLGLSEEQYKVEISEDGMSWDIDSALLIHDPGRFSPFGRYNRFHLPNRTAPTGLQYFTIAPGSLPSDIYAIIEGQIVSIIRNGAKINSLEWRYPLFWFPDTLIKSKTGIIPDVTFVPDSAINNIRKPSITLPSRINQASIQVFRNGSPTNSYSYDEATGEISLYPSLLPNEIVIIRYFLLDEAITPIIQAKSGTRGELERYGINWSVSQQSFWGIESENSEEDNNEPSTGSTTLELNLAKETDDYRWSISMRGKIASIAADENNPLVSWSSEKQLFFPPQGIRFAAAPERIITRTLEDYSELQNTHRGELYYRKKAALQGNTVVYPSMDFSNIALLDGTYSTDNNNLSDPYIAKPIINDSVSNLEFTILDYVLNDEKFWVGAHLLTSEGTFSEASKLKFEAYSRNSPATDDIKVIAQIGYLSEDIDGNGKINLGSDGIDFEHIDGRIISGTYHGGLENWASQGGLISEDWNKNGLLDYEPSPEQWIPELSIDITNQLSDGQWESVEIDLSTLSIAARQQICLANGIRIIILMPDRTPGNHTEGVLAFGDWEITAEPSIQKSSGTNATSEGSLLRITGADSSSINGSLDGYGRINGKNIRLTIHGDDSLISPQTVNGKVMFFDTHGNSIEKEFSLQPGVEHTLLIPVQHNTGELNAYR
ncbi:MAG: hypothetical protein D6B26_02310, partial [Spirochaetaceae bacterium]